jgi:eukaryotic-like serine/threonine-protein kinase
VPNTAETLQAMTQAYVFEKDLCNKCAHLSKIAQPLESGFINPTQDAKNKVEYLIFELADEDIRSHLDTQEKLDIVFLMRTLHHVAIGLSQLHKAQIAHQDLKPSNVLIYNSGISSKICDLGRAWDKNIPAPHDNFKIAGDTTYAPIDAMYGVISSDHRMRRFGCDLYHLGSLIVFLFTRVHMNSLIFQHLAFEHRSVSWTGTYDEVLPYVNASFELALQDFSSEVPEFIRNELWLSVNQLCNPDPIRRGDPKGGIANQFSLERFISLFDRLSKKASLELHKKKVREHA